MSSIETRFWSRVERTETCWLWTGVTNGRGYGQIHLDGKMAYVHRVSYELFVGPIPEGFVVDHTCEVKNCVNPDHLDAVTQHVNNRRIVGRGMTEYEAGRECRRGHPLNDENLYINSFGGWTCRACRRERRRHRRE